VSTSGEVLTQLDEQAPYESVWKKLGRTLGQDEEWPEARGSTRDSRWGARPAMKPGRRLAENNVDGLRDVRMALGIDWESPLTGRA
jgi:hypothetical protein